MPIAPGYPELLLHVVLGIIFLKSGYPKLFKDFTGTKSMMENIGFKPGAFWAFIVGALEFFGGILLIIGLLTELIAGLLALQMIVALILKIFVLKAPFASVEKPGWDYVLLLLVSLIALTLLGGGPFSVDASLGIMLL